MGWRDPHHAAGTCRVGPAGAPGHSAARQRPGQGATPQRTPRATPCRHAPRRDEKHDIHRRARPVLNRRRTIIHNPQQLPLHEILPEPAARAILQIAPGSVAVRAGTPVHKWSMWGRPMFYILDDRGRRVGMCTRTVVWSDEIADRLAALVGCPVDNSRYGRAARLARGTAGGGAGGTQIPSQGEIGACTYQHAVNGACPVERCS